MVSKKKIRSKVKRTKMKRSKIKRTSLKHTKRTNRRKKTKQRLNKNYNKRNKRSLKRMIGGSSTSSDGHFRPAVDESVEGGANQVREQDSGRITETTANSEERERGGGGGGRRRQEAAEEQTGEQESLVINDELVQQILKDLENPPPPKDFEKKMMLISKHFAAGHRELQHLVGMDEGVMTDKQRERIEELMREINIMREIIPILKEKKKRSIEQEREKEREQERAHESALDEGEQGPTTRELMHMLHNQFPSVILEGVCFKKEHKSGIWKRKYFRLEGISLNFYKLDEGGAAPEGGPRGSSIPDLTGVLVIVGREKFFRLQFNELPKITIKGGACAKDGTKHDVEFATNVVFEIRGGEIITHNGINTIVTAIENISSGIERAKREKRERAFSLPERLKQIDNRFIETKKRDLDEQTSTKISRIETDHPDDIFIQTFNRLKRVSGASFVRLLRINGINIVLIGDPHASEAFGKDERGVPRMDKPSGRARADRKYESDRMCEDHPRETLQILEHRDYGSFKDQNYGIAHRGEGCAVTDLVQFCIDNSSTVEVFPEAALFKNQPINSGYAVLGSESAKHRTMFMNELYWLPTWNTLTLDQKNSAKDIVKVHATDQRGGSYMGISFLIMLLIGGWYTTPKRHLTAWSETQMHELCALHAPQLGINPLGYGQPDPRRVEGGWGTRLYFLNKLHRAIIESDDPWQTIRDIYVCLATFGISPQYLTQNIRLSQNYLSDHIGLLSFEDLCLLLSLGKIITPQEIQSIKESVTDEGSLSMARGRLLELLKSNPQVSRGNPVSPEYLELYRQHYGRAGQVGHRPQTEYMNNGLKINEFLVDYFFHRGFIDEVDKRYVTTILHFLGLDFYVGNHAHVYREELHLGNVEGLLRPNLMSELEFQELQSRYTLTEDQRDYYSPGNNRRDVINYTTINPFSINGVKIARTTRLAKQLLEIERSNIERFHTHVGIDVSVDPDGVNPVIRTLGHIFSYLRLIGRGSYQNHYWGHDFLYDVFTCLRLERLLLKHLPLYQRLRPDIDLKTAATLYDMLEKEKGEDVTVAEYISQLPESDLQSKITASREKPKTILVIGGAYQKNTSEDLAELEMHSVLSIDSELIVGDQYAYGHPVETLKFLNHVFSEVFSSGRGGGIVDDRSDCSVLEGFFGLDK